jgi:predicted lipoprotein
MMSLHKVMPSRQPLVVVAALVGACLLCWWFPVFHIVPLAQAQQMVQDSKVDVPKVAEIFWNEKLLPATETAVDVKDLLAALAKDPIATRKQFGHALGIGGATIFLVHGSGKVAAIEDDDVAVTLDGTNVRVSLATGLLFGNTVRDATGLIDVNAYPNSQDFNDLSTELNAIVEKKVSPALRQKAALGKNIRFSGCCELDEDAKPDTLLIIPLKIDWP